MRAGFMSSISGRKSSSSSSASGTKKSDWYVKQFEEFYDAADGTIGPEGIEKLCTALGVDPTDVLVLVLAWLLGASTMGYFSREEWLSGQATLGGCTSPESMLEQLQAVYAATRKRQDELRLLHRFTHSFCREDRKKNIDVAVAVPMLSLLHAEAFPGHVPKLCEFLQVRDA